MSNEENNADPGLGGEGFEEENPFEDFESGGGGTSFSELFRTNPMVKIGVVLGGFAAIVGGIILFGGEKEVAAPSVIRGSGSKVVEAPGTKEVSPAYQKAVVQKNLEEVEKAIREGSSALPVPVSTPTVGRVNIPEGQTHQEDPLVRWRRIQEERQMKELEQQNIVRTVPGGKDPNAEIMEKLTTAMATQMQSVLGSIAIEGATFKAVAPATYFEDLRKAEEEELIAKKEALSGGSTASGEDGAAAPPEIVNIILPAGTIEYAQLITEANSDAPGPVLAEIVSGPLAGSRMLGSFEVEHSFLILNFDTVVIDGISHAVDAVALDPETTSTGMVTDIDRRYFQRVILPAAASFVEGMGSAIAEAGTTSVTVDSGAAVSETEDLDTKEEVFKGVEEAASTVSELIEEEADEIEPMIKVAAGTPMGVLFLDAVTEDPQ